MSIFITFKQYEGQINRVEKANLKNHGTSLSRASIANAVGSKIILEIRSDEKTMLVVDDWRQQIKQYLVPVKGGNND